jgi:L-lactate utilization protein LutC
MAYTADEVFTIERHDFMSGNLAYSMNLTTAPGKTDNIEGPTVTGIHGPLEIHVIILSNS